MVKMIAFSEGNMHDINHFMKVWGFAHTIATEEKAEPEIQETVEIAAIIHDIACNTTDILVGKDFHEFIQGNLIHLHDYGKI